MKPQAAAFLEKSRELLERADKMLGVGLEDAGRTAYLAAFHAAQALIFEHRDKAVKPIKEYGQNFSVSPSTMRASTQSYAPSWAVPTTSRR